MIKQQQLEKISREIEACKECKKDSIGMAVPGEGSAIAKIAFIGEAPGRKESESGRPFVGRSGQLLRKLINDSSLKEKDVYITSPVKRLPKRGTPSAAQIAHGMFHLTKQLEVINPRIIVLLGATATVGVLGEKLPVLKRHGEIVKRDGRSYFLTLHPAAAIRFQKFKKLIEEDFKKLAEIIKD